MNFALLLFIFLSGGVVIAFAVRLLSKSREITDDPLIPEQLHFMYDFYREKLRRILKE